MDEYWMSTYSSDSGSIEFIYSGLKLKRWQGFHSAPHERWCTNKCGIPISFKMPIFVGTCLKPFPQWCRWLARWRFEVQLSVSKLIETLIFEYLNIYLLLTNDCWVLRETETDSALPGTLLSLPAAVATLRGVTLWWHVKSNQEIILIVATQIK